jgi:hypothetical protein
MAQERKKVVKKPVTKVAPKKRPEPEPEPPKERKPRAKASDDKYVRVATNAKQEETRAIGERVQRGELKWSYYAGESDKGYHYYLVIKKES